MISEFSNRSVSLVEISSVLLVSHAMSVPSTWSKLSHMRRYLDVNVLAPAGWKNYGRQLSGDEVDLPAGLIVDRPLFSGRNHFHFYPNLYKLIKKLDPDIVHIDEEPYSLVSFHTAVVCKCLGIPFVFFTWQNIYKEYPWPFSMTEAYVMRNARAAIGGNRESLSILRRKGFVGETIVIPQFGVDSVADSAPAGPQRSHKIVGFAGRLVPEKGLETVIEAIVLCKNWEFRIVGAGASLPKLVDLAKRLGVFNRVTFLTGVESMQVESIIRDWDVLVLPSLTRANWKEQFGRVIIEAMNVGTCVLGSSSGEIPNVIGDAGLVFEEGSSEDLARALRLLEDDALRETLREMGRQRSQLLYSQSRIVKTTIDFYNLALGQNFQPKCCVL